MFRLSVSHRQAFFQNVRRIITVNILILYKATCFDFHEIIVRPFTERFTEVETCSLIYD
jgi:hypothetical protein